MKKLVLWIVGITVVPSLACLADEPSKAPRSRLTIMLQTKFVSGKKLKGPPEEYVDDKNPNTIELVALPKDDPGPSRVSADGQVIFLTQQDVRGHGPNEALMEQAFDIIEKSEVEATTNK